MKNIDEDVWRKFVAYCKFKGIKAGEELNEILKRHIKKNLKKLI